MDKFNCKQCKTEFNAYPSCKREFCSMTCYRLSRKHHIKEWTPCLVCGGEKKIRSYKYCSPKCSGKASIGRSSWVTGKKHSVEARKKMSQARLGVKHTEQHIANQIKSAVRGSKSHLWKGGITSLNKIERTKFRLHLQNKVFLRDDYTCQICGKRGVSLQVDHIQSWKDYVELRFDLNNCRTLCMDCHYQITFGKPKPKNVVWGHNLKHVIERMVK